MSRLLIITLVTLLFASQCAINENYTQPEGPHYTANFAAEQSSIPDSLLVVSYNIKYSRKVKQALQNLQKRPQTRSADILLLQEIDAPAADTIAQVMHYNSIYYPATEHIIAGQDFGNAVLCKYPIIRHEKFIFPHLNPWNKSIRIATIAVIENEKQEIALVSLHAETSLMSARKKKQQIEALAAHLETYEFVICGGDFNTASEENIRDMENVMAAHGFKDPTQTIGVTAHTGPFDFLNLSLDRIFTRGFQVEDFGKIIDYSASDHIPIWVKIQFNNENGL